MLRNPRVLVSLGFLGLLAAYVVAVPPRKVAGTRLQTCPMELAGMPGTQLELGQAVLDDLDPDDYLIRQYNRPDGVPLWLVIVYFQNARLGAHDPQVCYRSQGFRVEPTADGSVATSLGVMPYHEFLAVKGPRRERVRCLWYTAGGVLAEVKGWRDRMFFQGLRSNRSFGAFVRISTLETGDPAQAQGTLDAFTRSLAPHLPGFFPEDGLAKGVRR